jgi:hypothetical protein
LTHSQIVKSVKQMALILFIIIITLFSQVVGAFNLKVQAAMQASYYVDPVNGNDIYNGLTTGTAFHTITKARDAVRTINSNMTGDIIVYLRGGTYPLTLETQVIGPPFVINAGENSYILI